MTRGRENEFEWWFANGRDYAGTAREFGVSERTVYNWATRWFWRERADYRDEAARQIVDQQVGREQAEALLAMRRRHKQAGQVLQQMGLTYLKSTSQLTDDRTALAYIKEGIKIELTSEQIPSEILELMTLSDDELLRRYTELDQIPEAR